jgi:hypothetical protein
MFAVKPIRREKEMFTGREAPSTAHRSVLRHATLLGIMLAVTVVLAGPAAAADYLILGTSDNDTIVIDEPNNKYTVNGVDTYIDGTAANNFTVNSFEGADRITILDYHEDDIYTVHSGAGADEVTVEDSRGLDDYEIETGNGNDTVLILDSASRGLQQRYVISTGRDHDSVEIVDGLDPDRYDVSLNQGDDSVTVTDASGPDSYFLHGGLGSGDTMTLNDPAPEANDSLSFSGFELVFGNVD